MLDLSGYPPAPVLWFTLALDVVCQPLGCASSWRQWLNPEQEWLKEEVRVGSITQALPNFMSYSEFLKSHGEQQEHSLQQLWQFLFHTPSTTLADLTTPSALMVLVVLVLLERAIKAVLLPFFSNLGRTAGRATHGVEWERANEIRIIKFGEYVFRLVFHSSISIAGVYYFWDKEWWIRGNTFTLWQHYPHQVVEPGMIWYYLVQSAYNLEAMISLLELSFVVKLRNPIIKNSSTTQTKKKFQFPIQIDWSDTVRGDFQEMFVHHIITNILILGSSFFRLTRSGSMVFLVHDLSDVPVDLSKLANFLKWKRTTVACFTLMVVVWCLTRLGILPFVIYKSVLLESWQVCDSGVIDPIFYVCYRHIFFVSMGLLIFLHLAWFTMFLKMGYVLVRKGETHDLSEHKSGEDQQGGVSSSSSKKKKQ